MNYRNVPGVKYIAGLNFKSEYGEHKVGDVVEQAESFQNLEVLVSNRFLWPYAPEEGYDWLPPHLFNHVQTEKEVRDQLAGDPDSTRSAKPFGDGVRPRVFQTADEEKAANDEIYAKIRNPQQPGAPKAEPEQKPAAKKTAAKKTTAKKTVKKSG